MKKVSMLVAVVCSTISFLNVSALISSDSASWGGTDTTLTQGDVPGMEGGSYSYADQAAISLDTDLECLPYGTTFVFSVGSRAITSGDARYDSYAACARKKGLTPRKYIYELQK